MGSLETDCVWCVVQTRYYHCSVIQVMSRVILDMEESASHPPPSSRGSASSGAKHSPPGQGGRPDWPRGVPPPRGPVILLTSDISG